MIIKKVTINNFKSIKHIELDFDKVGNSYTKIFVGLNESGKSNILEALSYYNVPDGNYSFSQLCNRKFVDNTEFLDITFQLDFEEEEKEDYNKQFKDTYNSHPDFKFALKNITKKIFLKSDSDSFDYQFNWGIELPSQEFYITNRLHNRVIGERNYFTEKTGRLHSLPIRDMVEHNYDIDKTPDQLNNTKGTQLTQERFKNMYGEFIEKYIREHEPKVSFWNPSYKYLISDINLHEYAKNISGNRPLKNIFGLGGFLNIDSITKEISLIKENSREAKRLAKKLEKCLNDHINKIWNNNIHLEIDIDRNGYFSLFVKDKGDENTIEGFTMEERSQGAKQFLSLLLSLSLETKNQERKNELILIDEPEVHLHPSGIRDLSKELLKIGQDNYIFLATHSPFIIDKRHPERHYIVKKNNRAITEITRIEDSNNLLDDEVLNEAFGINVYRDLLNPHRVLVEGASDKKILQKAFEILEKNDIGITNGCGSNIVTLSSLMNQKNISILVIVDDDNDGQSYKKKIIETGGVFNNDNVFTIHDLVSDIIQNGTIEDTLDPDFIKSTFNKFYKETFNEAKELTLKEGEPVIRQIESMLKNKMKDKAKHNIDLFKARLSNEFNPTATSLSNKNRLLDELAKNIIGKLNSL